MPFIGQQPITGAYSVLDDITTSATATYNLQLNSAAYSPASANNLLVSLNGVIQKPGSSFTISGSQITFSSALTSSDSIDFIIALGDVLSVGTPTDGSVSTASLAPSAVTDAKISAMAATKLTGTVSNARFPAGSIVNVASQSFNPSTVQTSNTGMQNTGISLGLTMSSSSNHCLVTVSGGHGYMSSGYADGLISTICRNGGTTTYSTANDLTGGAGFGMEQIYNAAALNTAGHSFAFLDTSVGTTTPVYRIFFRSRSGGTAVFHEQSGSYINMTVMEIKQ